MRLVQAIVAEARVLWRQSGKFPLDSSDPNALGQVLHAAGALPSNAWDAASGTIRSPWGGKISISSRDPFGNLPGTLIVVAFENAPKIPTEVCARIAVFDGSTTSGVLGDGIAYMDMNVFQAYGSAAFAPSDKFVAAYPGVTSSVTDWGGLNPATAGEACKGLEEHLIKHSVSAGFAGFAA